MANDLGIAAFNSLLGCSAAPSPYAGQNSLSDICTSFEAGKALWESRWIYCTQNVLSENAVQSQGCCREYGSGSGVGKPHMEALLLESA
jgi:hypothetical protein